MTGNAPYKKYGSKRRSEISHRCPRLPPTTRLWGEASISNTTAIVSDLVTIDSTRNVPMTTSLKVAEVFGKMHCHVMEAVQKLDCSKEFRESNYRLSSFKPERAKRSYPMYLMTRDGFTFLAMGFTGARAAEFKERYIAEFNRMEAEHSATKAFRLPSR